MAKGSKKRRANRKKREMGLRVQTSCSGIDDFLPSIEHGDDVFCPKTPVQANEGDEKDRISETEVGSSASQTDEPGYFQGLPSQKDSAENLGFHEYDVPQMDDAAGFERLGSMLKEKGSEAHEFSRGSPVSSSEAVIKWEQLIKSKEFLGGLETVESSEDLPLSSSEAIIKWISLGKLECAIPDGHEALQIPEEENEHRNDAALGYSEQDGAETWIRPKEEALDGHGALHDLQEHNWCGNGTVLGCSLQLEAETDIQSKEKTVDGHETLHTRQGFGTVPVPGCFEQNYVETCMHCKEETMEGFTDKNPFCSTMGEKLFWDVLTVLSDPEGNTVGASGISIDEALKDVKHGGIGEGVRNGSPFSSTLGEKSSLEVLGSWLDPVEVNNIPLDEIVEGVRNSENYFEQDYVEICMQCKEETVEDVKNRDSVKDVVNGNPPSTLGEQASLEMRVVFSDSERDVAKESDKPKGKVVGDVNNRDGCFEQDSAETCTQNMEETVEDVKGNVSKDDIVEDVNKNELYFGQDYIQSCMQCIEETVDGVKKGPLEDVLNGNLPSTLEEQFSLGMLAVFNDSEYDAAEASDTPKVDIVGDVKNRNMYFEQDHVETCIQIKEEPVEDVKIRNPFYSVFGEKFSFEVPAVFDDSQLDVVEARNASEDEIVEDMKNNESYFEQAYTQSCIQCKEETVEGVKNGDPVEDVRNGNPFLSTLVEKPSLEKQAVLKNFVFDVVDASSMSMDETVEVAKNSKIYFEQDYIETCIQCKEGTLEDAMGIDHVEDVTTYGKTFSPALGREHCFEVPAVFDDPEHDVVEVSSISKDAIVEDVKIRESYFEHDYVKTFVQYKEETVEDVKNGNSSSALGENPCLVVLPAFSNFKLDLAESTNISVDEVVEDVSLEGLVFAAVDKSGLNTVEAGNGSRDEIVQDVKPRDAFDSTLLENSHLEVLRPVSDNSQLDVELCNQSKYEGVGDAKAGDGVCSTIADEPALEVLGLPLFAAESSTEKAESLLANDLEPVDASAGIFQDAQTIQEKPDEEIDMDFSNHLQHEYSAKITEDDTPVRVERPLIKDPHEGDERTHAKSTSHEDPNVEDDNHLFLLPQESPSLRKKFWKVLDCWPWFWS